MKMTITEYYHPVRSLIAAVLIAGVFGLLFVVSFVGELIVAAWDTLVLGKSVEEQMRDDIDGGRE
jgi:hypothetical protein